jgi:hypothetical protein
MRNFPSPWCIIVQHVEQHWSCCDQSPSGILLVVELDYLPFQRCCFSHVWTPFPDWGGFPPHIWRQWSPGLGEWGVGRHFMEAPLAGVQGKFPQIENFGKIAL